MRFDDRRESILETKRSGSTNAESQIFFEEIGFFQQKDPGLDFFVLLHQGQITESDSLIPLKVIDQNEAKELKTLGLP